VACDTSFQIIIIIIMGGDDEERNAQKSDVSSTYRKIFSSPTLENISIKGTRLRAERIH
jgi:hypothetical protein